MLTVNHAIEKHYKGPAHFARAWGIEQKRISDWRKAGFVFLEVERDGKLILERYSKRGEIEVRK